MRIVIEINSEVLKGADIYEILQNFSPSYCEALTILEVDESIEVEKIPIAVTVFRSE